MNRFVVVVVATIVEPVFDNEGDTVVDEESQSNHGHGWWVTTRTMALSAIVGVVDTKDDHDTMSRTGDDDDDDTEISLEDMDSHLISNETVLLYW